MDYNAIGNESRDTSCQWKKIHKKCIPHTLRATHTFVKRKYLLNHMLYLYHKYLSLVYVNKYTHLHQIHLHQICRRITDHRELLDSKKNLKAFWHGNHHTDCVFQCTYLWNAIIFLVFVTFYIKFVLVMEYFFGFTCVKT